MKKLLLFIVLIFSISEFVMSQTIRYVTPTGGATTKDGTSWTNAYDNTQLQAAINATGVTEVWVAAGTYKPTTGTNRTISFQMKDGVAIYGGFAGGENNISVRNLANHVTVLSGDIGTTGYNEDNSYHVVYCSGLGYTAVLDGVTIKEGYANGPNSGESSGAGIYITNSYSKFFNCTISGNTSGASGAGVYNDHAFSTFSNCLIVNNSAMFSGGGMANTNVSGTELATCTISGNSGFGGGGGIFNASASSINIYNSIIKGNHSPGNGSGIANDNGTVTLYYSCREEDDAGNNISYITCIIEDPLFVNSATGDYRILGNSPCIGNGSSGYNTEITDIRGQDRIQNGIDMGAYEWTSGVDPMNLIIYVDASKTDGMDDGNSWESAFLSLQSALDIAVSGNQIWVAAGTYIPSVDATGETSPEDPRTKCFQMKNGVAIYGGFAGWESSVTDRDWVNPYVTTLSGNLGGDNYSYHVFYNEDLVNTAILDGFTIQEGDASGEEAGEDSGGGMYNFNSSPTITNCTISENHARSNGGGMYNDHSSPILTNCALKLNWYASKGGGVYNTNASSPIFVDCKIIGNIVDQSGGGIYNEAYSMPTFTNCLISENLTQGSGTGGGIYNENSSPAFDKCTISDNSANNGGGIYNYQSSPILTNCVIKNNSATDEGGGVFNHIDCSPKLTNCLIINNSSGDRGGGFWNAYSSSPILTNCTIFGNNADYGGGIYNLLYSAPTINNSIIWGNTATTNGNQILNSGDGGTILLNYSCYENGSTKDVLSYGTITPVHCINTDPIFKYAPGADFRIFGNSPCADAGYNDYNSETTDIRGTGFGRKLSKTDGTLGRIDMGAYEYKFGTDPAAPQIIYVKELNGGGQDGKSWSTAYVSLQSALAEATGNSSIWVAAGTYKPTAGTDVTISFNLKNGVAIYGGFSGAGTETLLSERDWKAHVTILSGDIGTPGDNTDNSRRVIYSDHNDYTAVLDGFNIQDGNSGEYRGGGMYNWVSSPTLTNCTFTGNLGYLGGGITNYMSSPKLTNCLIINNSAYHGGGIYNESSSPALTNCLIANNSANSLGGGVCDMGSSSTLTNSTIVNNAAGEGGGRRLYFKLFNYNVK